jgi:signal transduction histidine kinase/methyl-accepting chemotaxis protein/ActR/RegA family two-component response regulator
MLVILVTCTVALLLACGVLAAYEMYDFRQSTLHDATVLANVLAKNTQAALAFQDQAAAQQTLAAIEAEPNVTGAALYDKTGRLFAQYAQPNAKADFAAQPGPDGSRFESDRLVIFNPVLLNNRRVGTLYLQTSLTGMYDRLHLFLTISMLVLVGSGLVALALSAQLQRPISEPIRALAETVRRIAAHKDYTLRARTQGGSETKLLTEAFNQLLASIEERDGALQLTNETLRQEVAERTGAEKKVQAQLARLELLQRITRAIGERLDLQSIFHVVLRPLEDHLPVDFCCICLYDAVAKVLTVTAVGAQSQALAAEIALAAQARIDIDENGMGRCVAGRLVYEPDVATSTYPFPRRLARGGLRSLVAAPLLVESKVFGVLVAARRAAESFSSGECEFLRQLSEHVALAAHQAQLHDALQQAYDDLRQTQQVVMQQERLRALGQMASGIAHDINNAISPISIYTDTLLETETELSARGRTFLETIQRAIEDVAHTVARMKEFYRQQETDLTLAPMALNDLIRQVIDLSRARWSDMPQQRGVCIEMKTDLQENLPPVLGVESEIREALVNLVFNAVDAMSEGGTLTLRTKTARPPNDPGHEVVQVEVSDTGVGMDEETRRRCLEPFFTTKGERGTGLGLAMVYGTIRRHHADIEIDSTPGQGTTMRLVFQVPETPSATVPAPAPVVVPTRLRLLVIDDDPLLIKSMRDTLEIDGHHLVTANGGREGIDAFRQAKERNELFDVVITDLGMPYVSGREVAAAIKGMSPSTPILLFTGWGQRLAAEGDVPPHITRVLNKPPKLRDLREALAQCMQSPSGGGGPAA